MFLINLKLGIPKATFWPKLDFKKGFALLQWRSQKFVLGVQLDIFD